MTIAGTPRVSAGWKSVKLNASAVSQLQWLPCLAAMPIGGGHPRCKHSAFGYSGHVMTDVIREHSIDQRLVSDASTLGLLSETREDRRIQPDCNQLTRPVTERRTANSSHRAQLIVGRLR